MTDDQVAESFAEPEGGLNSEPLKCSANDSASGVKCGKPAMWRFICDSCEAEAEVCLTCTFWILDQASPKLRCCSQQTFRIVPT